MGDSPLCEFVVLGDDRDQVGGGDSLNEAIERARKCVTEGKDVQCHVYQLVVRVKRTSEVEKLGPQVSGQDRIYYRASDIGVAHFEFGDQVRVKRDGAAGPVVGLIPGEDRYLVKHESRAVPGTGNYDRLYYRADELELIASTTKPLVGPDPQVECFPASERGMGLPK